MRDKRRDESHQERRGGKRNGVVTTGAARHVIKGQRRHSRGDDSHDKRHAGSRQIGDQRRDYRIIETRVRSRVTSLMASQVTSLVTLVNAPCQLSRNSVSCHVSLFSLVTSLSHVFGHGLCRVLAKNVSCHIYRLVASHAIGNVP